MASVTRRSAKRQDSPGPDPYIALPSRIMGDLDMPARVRVLAWLISHGASPLRAVRANHAVVARDLNIGPRTVRTALHRLASAEYITGEPSMFSDGRVYCYRLLFSHERKGATA